MEPYVDWFNVMTYDIHGVWDSSDRYTGPYVRPHTNLTEIDEGLSLLWRAGVSAADVVLGLGFYGRSFTLANPKCTDPGCVFSEGGKPGECTNSAGTLSAAEIGRIIKANNLKPEYDQTAAVKWIHWDTDQWVSYDDEETFIAKETYAQELGLSGTMVWAVDLGALDGTTNLQLMGSNLLLRAAGYTPSGIVTVEDYLDAGDSCYVSFCGDSCNPGYTASATMNGEVGELGPGSACNDGSFQTLCCLSGSFLGRCYWSGWRGQGLSCYSGGCLEGDTLMTVNTNHYIDYRPQFDKVEDQTCNGGTQSFCCRGFEPPLQITRDPALVQPEDLDSDPTSLSKRSISSCAAAGVVAGGTVVVAGATTGPLEALIGPAGLAIGGIVTAWCLISESEASAKTLVGWAGPVTRGQAALIASGAGVGTNPGTTKQPPKAQPKNPTGAGTKMYGR